MNITIVSKNTEITDTIRNKVESQIGKLEKYVKDDIDVNVKLDVKKKSQKIEVTIYLKEGYIIRAEESKEDLYSAIDLVYDKLHSQIRKYKTQALKRKHKNESIKFENIEEYAACDIDEDDNKIKRRKKLKIDKPMTQEDAIIQMDLLGHNFFVFKDLDTNGVSILYKRHDGYGVIEQL